MIETVAIVWLWVTVVVVIVAAAVVAVAVWLYNAETGERSPGGKRLAAILAVIGAALIALLVTGCSTPTVTKVETIEVKVPVAVQPIRAEDVPTVPSPLPKRSGNLSADADTLLAKVCEFVAYVLQADPLLRISAGEARRALPEYPQCEGR